MRTLVATATVLLLATGVALAKPTADESAAAREHYKRGTTLYDLGKYEEAIIEFQQAYEIKDDPVLLYNIAQSFRLSNKYTEALRFYRTYLRRAPTARNRDEVETKIADMENLIQQQARVATMPSVDAIPPKGDRAANIGAKPTPTPAPRTEPIARTEPPPPRREPEPRAEPEPKAEPEPEPKAEPKAEPAAEPKAETPPDEPADTGGKPGKGKLIGGIVIAVVGVAALGAGIGLGAAASGKAREVEKAAVFDPNAHATGQTLNGAAIGCMIGGGVLVAAGVVVAILGAVSKKPADEPKVSLLPAVSPTGAGASLQLAF